MNLLVFILHYLPFVRFSNGTGAALERHRRLCNAEICVYKYISRARFPTRTGNMEKKDNREIYRNMPTKRTDKDVTYPSFEAICQ